jgi:hypothetical protein
MPSLTVVNLKLIVFGNFEIRDWGARHETLGFVFYIFDGDGLFRLQYAGRHFELSPGGVVQSVQP